MTELSDSARTGGPAQIRLIHEVNAEVSEDARFVGLIGGAPANELGNSRPSGL